MSRLVIATHNPGKRREIGEILAPFAFDCISAGELGVSEPEETGLTFEANAMLKARHSATATGLRALADDSGLAVEALSGAPGIYSARWAGPEKDFAVAIRRIHDELIAAGAEPEGARAAFICVLCLAEPNGEPRCFTGQIEGRLTFPPRGMHGFGYDPIFVPEGHAQTFGEMPAEEKHRISHRAKAFAALAKALPA